MITPQQLIDLPHAGMAEKQLRKDGRWDDTVIVDPSGNTEYEFKVEVTGYYNPETETQIYTVIASSEDEAIDLAHEMCDFDEIEDDEVLTVKSLNQT